MGAEVHFFPVRHHSPTAARLVAAWIAELRPSHVLIEGPSDYNPQIDELLRPHELPIALYTYVVSAEGARRGAFYPFAVYSPEWQALVAGRAAGAIVRFIDRPWADLVADEETVEHRYSDHELVRSPYVARLCEELGVETFSDVWDELVEIDPGLDRATYLARVGSLCEGLRRFDRERPSDVAREAFMAAEIDRARREQGEAAGAILVVTGGYHTPALLERLARGECTPPPAAPVELGAGRGIALTPYSYTALDQLTGYEAGQPSPGFYHRVFESREAGGGPVHVPVLFAVAARLREAGLLASSADLIAVLGTARALADLRGHREVWRKDLLDAITSALVKEEITQGVTHPMLVECHRVLRGTARGRLAEGTSRPALVIELGRRLAALELEPGERPRELRLDLYADRDLERSRVLHACRVLGVFGFALVSTPSGAGEARLFETWRIAWHPELESSSVHASTYGPTIVEAVAARLLERSQGAERDAVVAVNLLFDAAVAGLEAASGVFARRVEELVRTDGSFASVGRALGRLLALYRYDRVLRTIGRSDVGEVTRLAYHRSGDLLDLTAGGESGELAGLTALVETFERCEHDLSLSREELGERLLRAAGDPPKSPRLRGAAIGAAYALGITEPERLGRMMRTFSSPDDLGDFLAGLFTSAREVVKGRPELLDELDQILCGFDRDEFLVALPALRLAFSGFTPREKILLAERLFGGADVGAVLRLEPGAETVREMLAFERELGRAMRRFGVRGAPADE